MKIFSNLATTLDGKIADPSTPHKMLGSREDRRRMDLIRQKADIVLMGATTLRATQKTVKIKKLKKGQRQLANAVVTASGDLDPDWDFWKDPDVVRFIFTSEEGAARALKNSRDRAFVVVIGDRDNLDAEKIVERIRASGFKNLLVEGGGETMALFLKKNLLQEVYLTLTPWILGGRGSPSLVGGEECLKPWLRLEKLKAEWKQGDLFCHFKVKGARRV